MNQNWIVENLNNAFSTWNGKLGELWGLVTTGPQTFKGGAVWSVMQTLHNGIGCLCLKQPPNWAWNPIRSAHIGVTLVRRFVTKWRVNNMIAFKELLVRAKRGEEKAFEELFEQFEPLVRKCSYMNGHTDEDLRQILLMEFVQAIRKFKI